MNAVIKKLNEWPYLLLVAAVFFWSGNFIVGRAVRADVPPIGLAFWRWAGASVVITFFAWKHLKEDWNVILQNKRILLILAFLGITVFNTLVYIGLQSTIAINAFLLQSMIPVLIIGMSFLIFRDKISALQFFGVLLSLAGALAIITQGSFETLKVLSINRGDLLVLIAVVSYAGYSVTLKKRPSIHALSLVSVTFIAGVFMLLPAYLWETFQIRPMQFNRSTLLAVGYVTFFPSLISYICYNRGVEIVGPNRAGLFIHLMPVFGSIMAILFLDEVFRWFHAVGIGLILMGIVMSSMIPKSQQG